MDTDLAQKAVNAALSNNWKEAIKLNNQIIAASPQDVDALNRLARAHAENCNIGKAKKLARQVLEIDPFNSIAAKSLTRWQGLKSVADASSLTTSAEDFLEEPGRTKIVSLIHLGEGSTVAKLDAGDELKLDSHSHRMSINTQDGKYIGRLPDDLSARLRQFITGGSEYKVYVKCLTASEVKVFLKETKNPSDVPSFPGEKVEYTSFTPPELVHKNDMDFPTDEG